MCGIAGLWQWNGQPVEEDRLQAMAKTIAHRGPDGEGIWSEGEIGFVHRRLAIIDISARGAQPMVSADERYVITFNGEIYNYKDLRAVCERSGSVFRSDSDTEVLLHLYARKGEKMLADLHGMFAFAIWDRVTKRLCIARDRLGKKPLFFRRGAGSFVFSSELQTLVENQKPAIDLQAVRVFLGLQYVPAPFTGFVDIESLLPGQAGIFENNTLRTWIYDDVLRVEPFQGTFNEAKDRVQALLQESVRLRLISDVPVGAFLSGGIDSSAVVALAAKQSPTPLSTFTMGFPAIGFDERAEAETFAKQLGTTHHSFEAKEAHAIDLLDQLVSAYAAPYADSSALPTWLLAKETSAHVKVVLTGDGADELFAGYRRYGYFLQALKAKQWSLASLMPLLERVGRISRDQRLIRFTRMLKASAHSPNHAYASLFTGAYFSAVDEPALLQTEFADLTQSMSAENWMVNRMEAGDPLKSALTFDRSSYLPDCLNVKMDRATMAHGLEARSPFLDQDLVRFVSSLPSEWLLHRGEKKYLLKQALQSTLPKAILNRKKRGFQVPLDQWFRGELKPIFLERCLSQGSPLGVICQKSAIQSLFDQHQRGASHGNRLWMLLTLSTWLQKNS